MCRYCFALLKTQGYSTACIGKWHLGQKPCFLPAIAGLAGIPVPNDRIIDGRNIWPLMNGDAEAASPHEVYFYYNENDIQAVRHGKWKLRRTNRSVELFDLREDMAEKCNLAENFPDLVEKLTKMMVDFDRGLKANARPAGVWAGQNLPLKKSIYPYEVD